MNKRYQAGFLRHVLLLSACLLGLLVIAALVVTLLRIPLDLARYKPLLESGVSEALGREISVDGDIVVTTSLWPFFELHGLRIANPGGHGNGDLASMELARISVGLLPLLQRKVRIREFRVSGLALDLVRAPDGGGNWVVQGSAGETTDPGTDVAGSAAPGSPDQREAIAADALSVDKLLLEDIRVSYRDGDQAPLAFVMERAEGAAPVDEPMRLSMQGSLLEEAFTLEVEANSLADFLTMTRSQLGMELDIAATRFAFSGLSEALRGGRETELQVVVEGADLSSMNDLLRLDLPPLADYRLRADLHAVPGQLRLSALEARVKDSVLSGSVLVDQSGERPFATVDLTAELIQLQDFDTGDWTAERSEAAAKQAEPTDEGDESVARAKVLSPEALARANAKLSLTVAQVLSGDDSLGSGELQLSLENGRLDLDPLQFKLPRASLLVRGSLKPGAQASEASLRVLLQNFDFGVLTRLSDPGSEVGGTLSVDLDITAAASNTHNILSGANGYLDILGHPENFRSGMVDLWAVNLLSAVVTTSSKDEAVSEINCLIGRFSLTDGVMTADNLAADTSKIRICGKGKISFVDNRFNLVARPKAKRPEFFSLATPLAVRGEFDDFRIGMKAGVLTLGTTATKFVISPITTPFRRVFKRDLPENGADICGLPIGPHQGELEALPGC